MARKHDVKRGDGYIEERERASGVAYIARWRENDPERGVVWRSKTLPTREDAEDHLRGVGRLMRSGRYVPDARVTVTQLVAEYLSRGARRWSTNTAANYRQIHRTIIAPEIGKRLASEVTPRMVQLWVDDLARRYSASRIEVIRAVLGGAFREAEHHGVVARNPVRDIRGPRQARRKRETWSASEATAVLASVRDDVELHAFYAVALTTGMRPGELRALQWKDVDTMGSIITVARSVTRNADFQAVIGERTKTGRVRDVAVPASTIAALQRWRVELATRRLRAEHWRDLDLVFPRPDGNLLPQQTIAKRHRRVCEAAGVPLISPHGMRHTYATISMAAGVPVKVISDALGHASVSITMDIYQHTDARIQRSAADALGTLLGVVNSCGESGETSAG